MCSFIKLNGQTVLPDILIRFETLEADFYRTLERLGLDPNENRLPHVNKSGIQNYRQYYDGELIDLVSEIAREDVKVFGYRYEVAPPPTPPGTGR